MCIYAMDIKTNQICTWSLSSYDSVEETNMCTNKHMKEIEKRLIKTMMKFSRRKTTSCLGEIIKKIPGEDSIFELDCEGQIKWRKEKVIDGAQYSQ